jgi:GntR family histidine utilization transcriptional repressor
MSDDATTRPDDPKRRGRAIHQRIVTDLETRILSGQWHTGFRIPTEKQLAEQYACSRITVSKALMILAQKGLVESRKRAGSFVRRPPSQSIILQILDPASVAVRRRLPHRYEMLNRTVRTATASDRSRLGLPRGGTVAVLEVGFRHFVGDRVYGYEQRLLNLGLLPVAATIDFGVRCPAEWLLEYLPWRSGETLVGCEAADPRIATALAVAVASPVLTIERRIHADGEAVAWGTAWHPHDLIRLEAHFDTAPRD